jgi:hypothetical protein
MPINCGCFFIHVPFLHDHLSLYGIHYLWDEEKTCLSVVSQSFVVQRRVAFRWVPNHEGSLPSPEQVRHNLKNIKIEIVVVRT